MAVEKVSVEIGGREVTLETGRIAKQASGSVWVTCGDSMVLVTAQAAKESKAGMNFLPLTVDYMEKTAAAGKIPGGFFKREGKPRDDETLTSRLIDRSIRPLFAEGWAFESQVIATLFSSDVEVPGDAWGLTGASTALMLSDIPFEGPIAGIRVCRIEGELQINPTPLARENADVNIFLAASKDAIVMVEGGGREMGESDAIDALLLGYEECQKLIKAQEDLVKLAGKPKRVFVPESRDENLFKKVADVAKDGIASAYALKEKLPRYAALDAMKADVVAKMVEADASLEDRKGEISEALGQLKYDYVRDMIVETGKRIDGRGVTDIRPITTDTQILPGTHGSALFTRGETQALVCATLGTQQDEQKIDDLHGEYFRRFMLHYNFPPYSVGEVKFLRGPGRREIGHGALAGRALESLVLDNLDEDFPYTIRIVGEITESNGSSSMATVCGGSMAMMDAGVPLKSACAGIAMGLIKQNDKIAILSDILGDEDHLGDMDFKVAGTEKGITAIQMDIKIHGVDRAILEQALEQARVGRLHILGEMAKTLSEPRSDVASNAPRMTTIQIKQDKIRDIIGPGGRVIKDIQARTGCQISIEDDGKVQVASSSGDMADEAIRIIRELTQEAEIGKLYMGNVRSIKEFGAFVEILPGTDGLIHISELAHKRVKNVEDVLQEGDEVLVKVIGIERGKVKLSRKQALEDEGDLPPPSPDSEPETQASA